jgi:hypothetical protein
VFSRSPTSYRLGAAVSPIRIQGTIAVRPKSNADQESRELGRTPERRQSPGKKMMLLRGVDLDFRVPGADDQNSNSAHVARDLNIPHGRSIVGAVEDHESVRVFECSTMFVLEPAASNQLPPPPPIEKLEPARSEILCAGAATLAGSRCGVWADDQRQVSERTL